MELIITKKAYERLKEEAAKISSDYFKGSLDILSKCVNAKREYKHCIYDTKILGSINLTNIAIFINSEKYVVKLSSKMEKILFPKPTKKAYKEVKHTSSLF